jgi:DNA mismatch repair protein PMS2
LISSLLLVSVSRFELLQRTTQLHQQPLLRPLPVETSAALELVIAEHAEIFVQNGFKIAVDLTAAPGQRVQLQSVPFSKTVQFGVDDVNELASMISERTGSSDHIFDTNGMDERMSKTYLSLKNDAVGSARSGNDAAQGSAGSSSRGTPRLPKLVAMYASRACRSAIMIGTALKQAEMEGVVHRLQGVEQPWNCPHGRPTLRHLVDLVGLREHKRHKVSAGMGTEMS